MGINFGETSGDKSISFGQEAWNIADGFTKIKLLRLLIEIDLYETFAEFGRKDLSDDNEEITTEQLNQRRVEAIHRVLFNLRQLIGNSRFAVDKKRDAEMIRILMERISTVDKYLDGISYTLYNDLTKEFTTIINEKHFKNSLDTLRQIKDELNFPLNRAGLIFKHSEEIDIDKMMDDISSGG